MGSKFKYKVFVDNLPYALLDSETKAHSLIIDLAESKGIKLIKERRELWHTIYLEELKRVFGDKEFSFEEAFNTIDFMLVFSKDGKSVLTAILKLLRRNGGLKERLDPKDSRKRVYRLI